MLQEFLLHRGGHIFSFLGGAGSVSYTHLINWKKVGLFASGTLFGTAGIKALASDDAKKLYTNCTAAVLRAKETVMNTVTTCLLYTSRCV